MKREVPAFVSIRMEPLEKRRSVWCNDCMTAAGWELVMLVLSETAWGDGEWLAVTVVRGCDRCWRGGI